jgi:F-type H+-transporting ATPase subunit a
MAAEPVGLPTTETTGGRRGLRRQLGRILLLALAVVVLDIVAYQLVPPFPKGGTPGEGCAFPLCFIEGNIEPMPPHVVVDLDPADPMPTGQLVVTVHPSITSTMVTMWLVMAVVLAAFLLGTRRLSLVPHGLQNAVEAAYEALEGFARSTGGAEAVRHVPFFAGFFILILACNWSGLVPPIGKLEELRAPTSDVNVTLGLALVSFGYFEFQGLRAHGIRGYLARFIPLGAFRNGLFDGLISLYVGLLEAMLEVVKVVTLAMRLFGNIYAGELAVGALTGLTVALVPIAMLGLELLLNFVQALIFSVLTLMFTLLAVEAHEQGEAHGTAEATAPEAVAAGGEQPAVA